MPTPAYLPPLHNGEVDDPVWWTGVLGETVPIPANLTRGLSIIINPLLRLPWLFNDQPAPPWVVDPMLFNGKKPGTPFQYDVSLGEYAFAERESRFDFWSRWIRDAILHGRGVFSYISGTDGPLAGTVVRHNTRDLQPSALEHATSQEAWSLTWNGTIYQVDAEGVLRFSDGELSPGPRKIHFIRGHQGGVVGMHAAELRAAAGVTQYAAEVFDSNVPSGVLTSDQPLTQEQGDLTREAWEARQYRRRIAILGNGTRYQQITMSPIDAAVADLMTLSNTQVAHMLELPAGMLDGHSGDSMTYANVNDARRDFVDGALASWAARVEESISALLPWGQSMRIDFTEYTKPTTPTPAPVEVPDAPNPA